MTSPGPTPGWEPGGERDAGTGEGPLEGPGEGADAEPAVGPAPRVLLLRPAGSGDALTRALAEHGLAAEHHPILELAPEPADSVSGRSLREAVTAWRAGRFGWLILTSPAALDALDPLMSDTAPAPAPASAPEAAAQRPPAGHPAPQRVTPGDPRQDPPPSRTPLWPRPDGARIAVVGRATAGTLRERGLEPDVLASGSGARLVIEMPNPAHPGEPVLFAGSSAAAPTVPEGLAARGYAVRREVAYRPLERELPPAVLRDLRAGAYSVAVLTSGDIARAAARAGLPGATRVVTIGEPTSRAAREAGLEVTAQAEEPSTTGLTDAVLAALRVRSPGRGGDGTGQGGLTPRGGPGGRGGPGERGGLSGR